MLVGGEREAMLMDPPPMRDSPVSPCFCGCLVFLYRHFPLQSPPSHPLNPSLHNQQQPSPWDCSTVPKLQVPAAAPSRGPASLSAVCTAAARAVISFHLGCHRWAVSLSALNVSPLTPTIAPMWGQIPASVPQPLRAGPVLVTLLSFPLVPSSYRVLCGSICSFPLVRYSCPLSAGVLHALLCLKVSSWCIRGERGTPHPPTLLPSCSPVIISFFFFFFSVIISYPEILCLGKCIWKYIFTKW